MKTKAYAIAEQCQVFGLNDNINPCASVETVIVRNYGVYLKKKSATKILDRLNLETKRTLGKKASEYFITEIDLEK